MPGTAYDNGRIIYKNVFLLASVIRIPQLDDVAPRTPRRPYPPAVSLSGRRNADNGSIPNFTFRRTGKRPQRRPECIRMNRFTGF